MCFFVFKGNAAHAIGKKVQKIDKKTNEIIKTYNTISDALRDLNLPTSPTSAISACCKGKTETSYGFKWQYVK